MLRVGHKKYETTLRYYVSTNQLSSTKMKAALNAMHIDDNKVEVEVIPACAQCLNTILLQAVINSV